ncbi:MAG: PilZ domain-containing protein [Bdellovibrio sp.]|nr:PilZ domain-containing protein [Bdellovibrio sp.]
MWQAPAHRMRAMALAKKRARERNRISIHIKSVEGHLKLLEDKSSDPEHTQISIKVILNDFGPKGVGIFSEKPFLIGQEIELSLENPRSLCLKGKIAWCQEYNANTHILSDKPCSYRIGIVFQFENEEQENQIKEFCISLEKEYLYGVPAYAMPSTHAKVA